MSAATDVVSFTYVVKEPAPAHGMTITGKRRPAEEAVAAQDVPLITAIHGGTYT